MGGMLRLMRPDLLSRLSDVLEARDAGPGLAAAVARLSRCYRGTMDSAAAALDDEGAVEAYLAARMPATVGAIAAALDRCLALRPDWETLLGSQVDCGSGSGSALWVAADRLPALRWQVAIERSPTMASAARALMRRGDHPLLDDCRWRQEDLREAAVPAADLVTVCYVLNELDEATQQALVARAWAASRKLLLLVEAGTPRGFHCLMQARSAVQALGAQVLAPCPQIGLCPLRALGEWCHMPVRVARRRRHRVAKGARCGFEDEPMAFLALQRRPVANAGGRIIDRVRAHKAAVQLRLCTAEGLVEQTIPRRDPRYRTARKCGWGDWWEG